MTIQVKAKAKTLLKIVDALFEEPKPTEVITPVRTQWVFDIECYRNYFLAAFKNVATGEVRMFEQYDGLNLDVEGLRSQLHDGEMISFNGNYYDMPILTGALRGYSCELLKRYSDKIIIKDMKPWKIGLEPPNSIDHVDLIEVAPGQASLKIYGGRMHCPKMQDLPIEPDADITPEQREQLRRYCVNDLDVTLMLYRKLEAQINLRRDMSRQYGVDLRSKSDAQIAEAVIKAEVSTARGKEVERPPFKKGFKFKYKPPAFIAYCTDEMKAVFETVKVAQFIVSENGSVLMPKELEVLKIAIGSSVYQMGIGGLHSTESSVSHKSDDEHVVLDRDVASYYPNLILNLGLFPPHMGTDFKTVYKSILDRRLAAKRSGDKVTNESLKIVLNGSFGKFGSRYSILYSPELLIQTTVTGQLALLMLIEQIEQMYGANVVSANTDGIVIRCRRDQKDAVDALIRMWEKTTGLETEEAIYDALYSKDVNNYFAFKHGGGVKLKGLYAQAGLSKNPVNAVCVDAVVKFLQDGTPVADTINVCRDVTKFLTVKAVSGGGLYDGAYLGKAVRWYYGVGEKRYIEYRTNGNKVGRSDGARPLMDLPEKFPDDVDLDWYIAESESILVDIGAIRKEEACSTTLNPNASLF